MNKKTPKNTEPETTYAERDIVLAKVRGFPPWPGMVVNPDKVPPIVAKERPTGKKTTFHCVRFFPAGDYAWLISKDISKLKEHEIQAYISDPLKRSQDLLAGYRIALNPEKWEKERENADMVAAEQEDNAAVDQLDSENEEDIKKPTKSKKRKRDSEAPASKPKPKAKPKAEKKPRKNGTKSKEMVESEDEGDQEAEGNEDAGPSAKAAPPPSKKPKREKDEEIDPRLEADPEARKVREWRHRLQKALLGSKGLPSNEEMPALDQLFTTVENYEHPDLINFLSFSKIGKVMRHIAALPQEKVPRDEEFKFRVRAKAMVDKWHAILGANKTTEQTGETAPPNGAPAEPAPAPETSEAKSMASPAQNTAANEGDTSLGDLTMMTEA